ncbi:hypothetical protein BSI_27700 [Bacillus inaquosorum KCTC 13429]|uniref:Uncharacterized protein n=1 Tax=Bacillus inaquosorum KCTC 13429 TaxID=1236548 RepID=A0A9W5PD00_9BACI|nr:hypothetical protein BSI_27700 [Bacillus inaquosorum KCTC 13429]
MQTFKADGVKAADISELEWMLQLHSHSLPKPSISVKVFLQPHVHRTLSKGEAS